MELNHNVKNVSKETITLAWGKFSYTLKAGETQFIPSNAKKALLTRFPKKIVNYVEPKAKAPKIKNPENPEDKGGQNGNA